jgi:hypothetical protein
MENWQKEDACIDAMWQIIYDYASFFNKKVNLMSYIYGDIVDKFQKTQNGTLSVFAKKKLYENNITKYFSGIRDGALETIQQDTDEVEMDLDGEKLNKRGFARLSVLSNINSEVEYSPRNNKNIFLALGNALKDFNLDKTKHEGKGFFEVLMKYMENHRMLFSSTPKAVSNSFCSNSENERTLKKLYDSFENYLLKRIKAFQKDLRMQKADNFSINVIRCAKTDFIQIHTTFRCR